MQPLSEAEILSAFRAEHVFDVPLPSLNELNWEALDYLGWVDPSGHPGYVVVISPEDGRIKGTVLKRGSFGNRRPGFEMCSLCHHVHQPNGTAMYTITRKDNERRHSIGNIVCKDLDCSLRLRNLVGTGSDLGETLYPEARIWRMQLALHKWLKKANRL